MVFDIDKGFGEILYEITCFAAETIINNNSKKYIVVFKKTRIWFSETGRPYDTGLFTILMSFEFYS